MDNNKVVLHSRLDLAFSLNYFSFFIVNFVHLKLLFFTLDIFSFFYLKINQICTITSLTFQVSKMDLLTFLAQLASILRVKL